MYLQYFTVLLYLGIKFSPRHLSFQNNIREIVKAERATPTEKLYYRKNKRVKV